MTRWLQWPLCCEERSEVLTGNTPVFIILIIHFSYKIGCHPAFHESYLSTAKINVPKADFLKTTCQLTNCIFGLGEGCSDYPSRSPCIWTAAHSGYCFSFWVPRLVAKAKDFLISIPNRQVEKCMLSFERYHFECWRGLNS